MVTECWLLFSDSSSSLKKRVTRDRVCSLAAYIETIRSEGRPPLLRDLSRIAWNKMVKVSRTQPLNKNNKFKICIFNYVTWALIGLFQTACCMIKDIDLKICQFHSNSELKLILHRVLWVWCGRWKFLPGGKWLLNQQTLVWADSSVLTEPPWEELWRECWWWVLSVNSCCGWWQWNFQLVLDAFEAFLF